MLLRQELALRSSTCAAASSSGRPCVSGSSRLAFYKQCQVNYHARGPNTTARVRASRGGPATATTEAPPAPGQQNSPAADGTAQKQSPDTMTVLRQELLSENEFLARIKKLQEDVARLKESTNITQAALQAAARSSQAYFTPPDTAAGANGTNGNGYASSSMNGAASSGPAVSPPPQYHSYAPPPPPARAAAAPLTSPAASGVIAATPSSNDVGAASGSNGASYGSGSAAVAQAAATAQSMQAIYKRYTVSHNGASTAPTPLHASQPPQPQQQQSGGAAAAAQAAGPTPPAPPTVQSSQMAPTLANWRVALAAEQQAQSTAPPQPPASSQPPLTFAATLAAAAPRAPQPAVLPNTFAAPPPPRTLPPLLSGPPANAPARGLMAVPSGVAANPARVPPPPPPLTPEMKAALAAQASAAVAGHVLVPTRPAPKRSKPAADPAAEPGEAEVEEEAEEEEQHPGRELRATNFPANLTSVNNYTLYDVALPPRPMPKAWAPGDAARPPGARSAGPGGDKATKPRDIVFVTAEAAPWSKTGGLGDVMGALPLELSARGHRVMVVTPRYMHATTAERYAGLTDTGVHTTLDLGVKGGRHEVGFFHQHKGGVDWVFIDHIAYHREGTPYGNAAGTYPDNLFRFALLSLAACEAPLLLNIGGYRSGSEKGLPYGQDVTFVANDWHAGLVPVYIASRYRKFGVYNNARCLLALHNLAHQGAHPPSCFDGLGLPPDWYGALEWVDNGGPTAKGGKTINVLKAALVTCDKVVTVSQAYAWEISMGTQGMGLTSLLQQRMADLVGIVNGIDAAEWDPRTDPYLPRNYHAGNLGSKMLCKQALQEELGLPVDPAAPLLGFIGRLEYQKGPDLVMGALQHLVNAGCQIVMLGSGAPDYEELLRAAEQTYPKSVRCWVGFSVPLSHKVLAASDILLMPSRFEPCGLNQMYAMRYGTVPVVHATGGLRDTVDDVNPFLEVHDEEEDTSLMAMLSEYWNEGKDEEEAEPEVVTKEEQAILKEGRPLSEALRKAGVLPEAGADADIGTGWTFAPATLENFMDAVTAALAMYEHHPDRWRAIQLAGMARDFSWRRAARQYEEVMDAVNVAASYCK